MFIRANWSKVEYSVCATEMVQIWYIFYHWNRIRLHTGGKIFHWTSEHSTVDCPLPFYMKVKELFGGSADVRTFNCFPHFILYASSFICTMGVHGVKPTQWLYEMRNSFAGCVYIPCACTVYTRSWMRIGINGIWQD